MMRSVLLLRSMSLRMLSLIPMVLSIWKALSLTLFKISYCRCRPSMMPIPFLSISIAYCYELSKLSCSFWYSAIRLLSTYAHFYSRKSRILALTVLDLASLFAICFLKFFCAFSKFPGCCFEETLSLSIFLQGTDNSIGSYVCQTKTLFDPADWAALYSANWVSSCLINWSRS